ncbi:FecR family protein [Pseudomonas solani]|uniref:FecR family protein n=1 Tax=Pseudomonas solani TaxID=2731552 RepID=UPI003C2BF02E
MPEPLAAPQGAGTAPGCAEHEEALREEAAFWFTRQRDGELDADEAARFATWLAASPEHEREYALLEYLWQATDRVPAPRLRALAEAPTPRAARRRSATRALALAASLVLAAGAAWLWLPLPFGAEQYATAAGERRQVTLADGTQVELNSRTRLEVRYRDQQRLVTLESGEAMFSVTHDSARPFVVEAGQGRVTVTGTRFDVRRDPAEVRVAVESGSVRVEGQRNAATRPLLAGDAVRISGDGSVGAIAAIDIAALTAWRQGKLVFNDASLADVVAEVSRYRASPVRVAPAVAGLRLSSVFRADDTDALLGVLPRMLPVQVRALPDGSREIIPL